MTSSVTLDISILPGSLAICRLSPHEAVPSRVPDTPFWSVSVTDEEISLVLPEEHVQPGWTVDAGWRCLKVAGPLDFQETGILASIAGPLSGSGISFFALSTYDTDYFLVREDSLNSAVSALEISGHTIS